MVYATLRECSVDYVRAWRLGRAAFLRRPAHALAVVRVPAVVAVSTAGPQYRVVLLTVLVSAEPRFSQLAAAQPFTVSVRIGVTIIIHMVECDHCAIDHRTAAVALYVEVSRKQRMIRIERNHLA